MRPLDKALDQPLPGAVWGALAASEDALARLGERLRRAGRILAGALASTARC